MDINDMARRFFINLGALQRGPMDRIQKLSQGEMALFAYLVYQNDQPTPTELSQYFRLTTARVANTLNSLERKGCIERVHDSVDRRKVFVHATDHGIQTFREIEKDAIDDFITLFEYLGEEDSLELLRIMDKIIAREDQPA